MLYFAYGSNLSPRRIEARLGPCRSLGTACLKGFRLHFHKRGADDSGKCNIRYSGDGRRRVYGGLYRLLAAQAQRLDGFEGQGYARQNVSLVHRNQHCRAYTYVALDHWIDDSLRPFDWYRALVIQGAFDQGLPRAYVCKLLASGYIIDPDQNRRRSNLLLLTDSRHRQWCSE